MQSKLKVILFGASTGGRRALRRIKGKATIVGFADNDPAKQSKPFAGYTVYSTHKIKDLQYDYILISSMYVSEIQTQLKEQGIPPKKIKVLPVSGQTELNFPWDAIFLLSAIALVLFVISTIVIL